MEEFIDFVYQRSLATHQEYTDKDTIFLDNNQLINEYVNFYGDHFITKSTLTRKLKKNIFKVYEIHKTSKKINRKTYRGFEIKKISGKTVNPFIGITSTPIVTLTIKIEVQGE